MLNVIMLYAAYHSSGAMIQEAAPIQQPKRLVQLQSFEIKCSSVSSGSGGGGFGVGVGSIGGGSSSSGPAPVNLASPSDFSAGLAEILKSKLSVRPQWLVLDTPSDPGSDPNSEDNEPGVKAQFYLTATMIDLNVSSSKSGINIAGVGGGENRVRNKVVLDLKLISTTDRIVLESVRGTGVKSTKSNFLSAYNSSPDPLFGFEDFRESPLSEACDLAIKDALDQLAKKLERHPWQAEVVLVTEEDGRSVAYLNVNKDCGLKAGSLLELVKLGEEIKDNKTGRIIGRARPTILGKVTVSGDEGDLISVYADSETELEVGLVVRLPMKK